MPFYRIGPGSDRVAHLNFGSRKNAPPCCGCPRFEQDNPQYGDVCSRVSVALCDAPGAFGKTCDTPMCEKHRTRDPRRADTDYCWEHASLAESERA